jgi:hypothetical protein
MNLPWFSEGVTSEIDGKRVLIRFRRFRIS